MAAVLSLPGVLMLGGCGFLLGDNGVFRDNSRDYLDAEELDPIELPAAADPAALEDIYPIPPIASTVLVEDGTEVPRPVPLTAASSEQAVRIQKLGDESWALVAEAPGQLWPQVRAFLTAAGVQVGRVDARTGIMETDWVQLRNREEPARFRFRIERGVQRGTSELHVLHAGRVSGTDWPEVSDDLEAESEMLRSVAQYIANSAESAPVSMIADQAISAGGKISLQESDSGETYIALELPFNRAWASLALALEDATFEITDQNRSSGRYYVRFLGRKKEERRGWFGWLGGGDDHPLAGRAMVVDVIETSPDSVQIRLAADAQSEALTEREQKSLLAMIQGNVN